MAELKLSRLPDQTPVKVSIVIAPDLHQALLDYASAYRSAYDDDQPVAALIPHMLAAFLASDRGFARRRGSSGAPGV